MSDDSRVPDVRDKGFDKMAGEDTGVPKNFARQAALFSALTSPRKPSSTEEAEEPAEVSTPVAPANRLVGEGVRLKESSKSEVESPTKPAPAKRRKRKPAEPTTAADAGELLEELLLKTPASPVSIETEVGAIKLPAKLVTVGLLSIGFFLSDDSAVEFKLGAKLSVTVKGEVYPVFYAGGLHRFPRCEHHMMSFIIDKEV